MKSILLLLGLLLVAATALIYDSDIDKALASGKSVDVLVHFPQYEYETTMFEKLGNRAQARVAVRKAREEHNSKYQPQFVQMLQERGIEFKKFWISNSVLVKNVNPTFVNELKVFPNVIELEAEKVVAYVIDPMVHSVSHFGKGADAERLEWNIDIIGTPEAWNITEGDGITVSNIDTGVLYTHEALIGSYRGNVGGSYDHDYNWFDPRGQVIPFDNNGHGTHTMGTIVGSRTSGVGVAPGSKWIAAKGCASSSCSNADLIASAEWVICPTEQGGSGEDCTRGADLVSNSWGGGRGSTTFLTYIQAWVDAGSVPLFSQGNSGSSCSTANSPGDLGIVIGIGSTNINDALSSFSSRGPGLGTANFPLQKPDISAPGESVRSAYPTTNTAYATLSGTSMACPHVAGLVGLMLSANPSLTIAQVRQILNDSAEKSLSPPNGGQTTCSGVAWTANPNYHYGYGRIDAAAAVTLAKSYRN